MKILDDRRYSKDHEWVVFSGSTARVGITDYAQDALGDVVFVQLPKVGDKFVTGATCCEVESTKSVSDIYAPISGAIARANERLLTQPGLMNSDPYGEGWLFELSIDSSEVNEQLLDFQQYRLLIEG
ncbi:MAG: glycine cleavage system protein GcvH [Actinobacteria bacterium]|nr:glycine cleavage system protein GcvH [Actinomycetota bacterium]NCW83504.1 glycine cleavage system protein GcvH [Acidimicrobiia bacterium]NBP41991.1 glycine cleavage system protein GcvH [Actinomycetota bacterium]NBY61149.1 glycine cleavage system protein GcvH [Actinomycetota bacterium]NDA37405.1 glycine cleavage system protein GcvH [Acidimicrobiia bacterium]